MNLADFRSAYPQFASTSDALVNNFLANASLEVGKQWDEYADLGTGLYVAHYCAIQAAEAAQAAAQPTVASGGEVVMKGVGPARVSRDPAMLKAMMEEPMLRTTYGQRFVHYRDLVGKGMIASGGRVKDIDLGLSTPDTLTFPASYPGDSGDNVL